MYLSTYGIKGWVWERIWKKFRKLAMKKYGYSKGSIKKASEEAIEN